MNISDFVPHDLAGWLTVVGSLSGAGWAKLPMGSMNTFHDWYHRGRDFFMRDGAGSIVIQSWGTQITNGQHVYGWFDDNTQSGIGWDDTDDVWIMIKGKFYSMNDLFHRNNML